MMNRSIWLLPIVLTAAVPAVSQTKSLDREILKAFVKPNQAAADPQYAQALAGAVTRVQQTEAATETAFQAVKAREAEQKTAIKAVEAAEAVQKTAFKAVEAAVGPLAVEAAVAKTKVAETALNEAVAKTRVAETALDDAVAKTKVAATTMKKARLEWQHLRQLSGAELLSPTNNPLMYILFFAAKISAQDLMAQIEELRTDKQLGATPSGQGTTSLVSKGSVPAVLAFAVENGALGRSVSGSAVTFRGNLIGAFDLVRQKGFLESYAEADPSTQFLRRFSYSVTFDPSREQQEGANAGTLPAFTGSTRQISGWSFRADIVNHRDPRRQKVREIWERFSANEMHRLNVALDRVLEPVFVSPEYTQFRDTRFPTVTTSTDAERLNVAVEFADAFWELARRLNPDLEDAVRGAVLAAVDVAAKRAQIEEELGRAPILALEYVQDRPRTGPKVSTVNLIAATQSFGNRAMLTGNIGFSAFNGTDGLAMAGTQAPDRLRNAYAALDLTWSVGALNRGSVQTGNVTFSLAAKYERFFNGALLEARLTEAGIMIPATGLTLPGDLAVAQAKVEIPIKGTGLRIPLSLSYANRTELIKEREVRGNFGLTFDMDQIVNKFKGVLLSQ